MRSLLLAMGVVALVALPAQASPTLWGYDGLVTMPDGRIARDRELEIGANALQLSKRPFAVTGFVRYGFFDSLETSLAYGVPGHPYVTGALKYQLLRPTPSDPTAVAIGASLLGVPTAGSIAGSNYFLAVTRDLGRWGSVHVGFEGDLALNSRLMVGLELPLGSLGRLMAEGRGPQTGSAPFANVGAEFTPFPWLRLGAGSVGEPGDWLARGYYAGGSLRTVLPEYGRWFTARPSSPKPSPTPSGTPAPRPSPAPTGTVQPPALPAATLIGRVVGSDGTPRSGYTALLVGSTKRAITNASGYFYFLGLTPGSYQVQVLDRSGNQVAVAGAQLSTEPVTVQVPVKEGRQPAEVERRGSVAGSVSDAQNGSPLSEARLTVVGNGVSVLAVSNAQGRFQVIDLPLGDYKVRAERKGYRPEALSARIEAAALHPLLKLTMTRERP